MTQKKKKKFNVISPPLSKKFFLPRAGLLRDPIYQQDSLKDTAHTFPGERCSLELSSNISQEVFSSFTSWKKAANSSSCYEVSPCSNFAAISSSLLTFFFLAKMYYSSRILLIPPASLVWGFINLCVNYSADEGWLHSSVERNTETVREREREREKREAQAVCYQEGLQHMFAHSSGKASIQSWQGATVSPWHEKLPARSSLIT